jgi:hypothetical protein
MAAMMNQREQGANTAISNTVNDIFTYMMDRPLGQPNLKASSTHQLEEAKTRTQTHPRRSEAQSMRYAETPDEQHHHGQ